MKVLLLAGEPSGDRMAAGIARALRELDPAIELRAMGGAALREAGAELVVDSSRLAVVGIVEVLGLLPELLRARGRLRREIETWRPDVLVPVDYPDFNVRIASWARARGVPVAWVVAPQVWAWRPGRVARYARAVSRMLVVFDFELPAWRDAGVAVEHVGHPLLDHEPPPSRGDARARLALPDDARVLALLPGSRRSEIARTWPVFAAAARDLARSRPDLRVVVPVAPGLDARALDPALAAPLEPSFVAEAMGDAVAACDLALVASGTATLETALMQRPLVVGYRVARMTMLLSRWLADEEFLRRGLFCLPNLVLGRAVVPELYQERFTVGDVVRAVGPLLDDESRREAMTAELAALRDLLGGGGAFLRIARAVASTAR